MKQKIINILKDYVLNEYTEDMKQKINEILIKNADDIDILSDDHAQSIKYYTGTLDLCIDEISDLFIDIKKDIEQIKDIYKCGVYVVDDYSLGKDAAYKEITISLESLLKRLNNEK